MTSVVPQHSFVRVTAPEDIARVRELALRFAPESHKFCFNLAEWGRDGHVSGDQGLLLPARPLLFVNDLDPERFSAAVLLYGNGDMEQVIGELHAGEAAAAAAAAAGQSSAAQVANASIALPAADDSWKTAAVSFYVSFACSPSSDALLVQMLRALVPLRSASFFFSAIPSRFQEPLQSLATEFSTASLTVRTDVNRNGMWMLRDDTKGLVRTERAEFRAALAECDRKYGPRRGEVAEDLSAATVSSAADSSATASAADSSYSAALPDIEIAPLRPEHVDLVVSQWPWASPSADALIGSLIATRVTRAVYIGGVPVAWGLEQRYGALGMLHTQEPFRRRGLGPLVVEALARPAEEGGQSARPVWAAITVGNTPSEKVFTKRGFEQVCEVCWVRWTPQAAASVQ